MELAPGIVLDLDAAGALVGIAIDHARDAQLETRGVAVADVSLTPRWAAG